MESVVLEKSETRATDAISQPFSCTVKRVFTLKERGTCVIVEVTGGKVNVGDELRLESCENLETLRVIGTFMPKTMGIEDAPVSPAGNEIGLIFTIMERGKFKNGDRLVAVR